MKGVENLSSRGDIVHVTYVEKVSQADEKEIDFGGGVMQQGGDLFQDVEEVQVEEQGLTTSARCNQCVSGRRSQSAENFLFWFL